MPLSKLRIPYRRSPLDLQFQQSPLDLRRKTHLDVEDKDLRILVSLWQYIIGKIHDSSFLVEPNRTKISVVIKRCNLLLYTSYGKTKLTLKYLQVFL